MTQFRPFKTSAVYRAHAALKATWIDIGEWRVTDSFGDPPREAQQTRAGVGLEDVSAIGKLDLKGAGVASLLESAARVDGVLAVLRIKPGHALVLTEPNTETRVSDALTAAAKTASGCVHVTDLTSALAAFYLVGPRATDVLNRVTSLDVRPDRLTGRSSAQCNVAHVHATVYHEDWGSLPAYLMLVGRDVGEYVWSAVRSAGAPLGLTPFGVAAERLLRKAEAVGQPVRAS